MYYNYPDPPVKRDGFPLASGAPITALFAGISPNVPADRNKNYQFLNEQVGTQVAITYVPFSNYRDKFQVTMASGDLPDMCMINPVPQMPALLERHFADLSEVLGGEGVRQYAGLANIPTDAWKVATINGRIYGIAKPLPPAGITLNSRGDVLAERGIDPNVTLRDGADFVDLLDTLTDRGNNAFAMGANPLSWLMPLLKTMVGTPNVWRNDGGRFVHEFETDEMKDALTEAGKIIQSGLLHPSSFSDPGQNLTWFSGGVTALLAQDFVGWGDYVRNYPEWRVGNIEIPLWGGGGIAPIRMSSPGYGSWVGFKKSDDARLDQLLRVADYVASPFGSEEYLNVTYGVADYSYQMRDGNPVPMTDAPSPTALQSMGGNHRAVLYGQGDKSSVDQQRDYLDRVLPAGVQNAALGLYSETAVTKAPTLVAAEGDVVRGILQGTKSMADWDEFVRQWKEQVGDAMAAELAAAAAGE